ncbi:LytR/AlgR family response regulator transcription factor [Emticicia fontis]
MKIVIIEDEPKTAANLEKIIKNMSPDYRILEKIDSVESGLQYFEEVGFPDLIFSDIQIADGLSFEIYNSLPPTCPIIFCTAYDQYALQAFRANGIDYLLKPFSETDVRKALEKCQNLKQNLQPNQSLQLLFEQLQKPAKQTILINFREKIIPVNIHSIPFFYSVNHQTIILFEGKEQSISYSLDELEAMLDSNQFYRANRQFIINRTFIREIEYYFARKLVVLLNTKTPENIVVSKAKASDFLRWMEG